MTSLRIIYRVDCRSWVERLLLSNCHKLMTWWAKQPSHCFILKCLAVYFKGHFSRPYKKQFSLFATAGGKTDQRTSNLPQRSFRLCTEHNEKVVWLVRLENYGVKQGFLISICSALVFAPNLTVILGWFIFHFDLSCMQFHYKNVTMFRLAECTV